MALGLLQILLYKKLLNRFLPLTHTDHLTHLYWDETLSQLISNLAARHRALLSHQLLFMGGLSQVQVMLRCQFCWDINKGFTPWSAVSDLLLFVCICVRHASLWSEEWAFSLFVSRSAQGTCVYHNSNWQTNHPSSKVQVLFWQTLLCSNQYLMDIRDNNRFCAAKDRKPIVNLVNPFLTVKHKHTVRVTPLQ